MNSGNTVIPQLDINKRCNCDEMVETELMFSSETWLPERSKLDSDLRGEDKIAFKSIAVVAFKWDSVRSSSNVRRKKIPTSSGPWMLK